MDELDFNIDQDPMRTAAEQADDKIRGIVTKVSKWRSVAVMGALFLIALVLPLASFSFVNPWSVDFVINAVYSLILAMTCYYSFSPMSAKSERLESQAYKDISKKWTELSERVRKGGLMTAFFNFCITRRGEEREERKALFIEAAGIPREIYDKQYSRLNEKQLKKLKRNGELTAKQVKYLCSANGEINVLPINASMILSGLPMDNINDAGREKKKKWFARLRPVTLILTMIIRGVIHVMGNTDITFLDFLTEIMTTASIILTWSFAGYRYGIAQVREEEQLMQGRSEFIQMFLERASAPKLPEGEAEQ